MRLLSCSAIAAASLLLSLLTLSACSDSEEAAVAPIETEAGTPQPGEPPAPVVQPTAAITLPAPTMWTTEDKARVVGTAAPAPGGAPVTSLTVNGVPAQTTDAFAHWTVDVPLVPGPNTLVVEVKDAAGRVNAKAAERSVESKVLFKGAAANVRVSAGTVYAIDGDRIVAMPAGGGAARVVVKASAAIRDFAIDGETIYFVTQRELYALPKAGGAATVIVREGDVPGLIAPKAIGVSGANVYLFNEAPPAIAIQKLPKAGGAAPEFVALDVEEDYDFSTASDVTFVGDAFIVALQGAKPASLPIAGGLASTLQLSLTGASGEIFPRTIAESGGSLYVLFPNDAATSTVYVAARAGGPLAETSLKVKGGAYDLVIDGADVYTLENAFSEVAKYPLAGGPGKRLSQGELNDVAYAGVADDREYFILTPAGITAYSRTDATKRVVYAGEKLGIWKLGDIPLLAIAGDTLYTTQGENIVTISKTTGALKILIPNLESELEPLVLSLAADEKYLFIGFMQTVAVHDAATGTFVYRIVNTDDDATFVRSPTVRGGMVVDATSFYIGSQYDLVTGPKAPPAPGASPNIEHFASTPVRDVSGLVLGSGALWAVTTAGEVASVKLPAGEVTKFFEGATKPAIWTKSVPIAAEPKGLVAFDGTYRHLQLADVTSGAAYFFP